MKKIIAVQLAVMCVVLFFAARTDALTVVESLKEFVAAEEKFLNSLTHSVPWDKISDDEALPLDPISELWGKFRPLFNLGISKESMEQEKDSFMWKNVTYN